MSIQYRGAVIERVEHRTTKRTGVIRLDKKHAMTFFAREVDTDIKQEPFASRDGAEVRRWLLEQLAHTTPADRLDWIPAIEVEHGGASRHYYRDSSHEEQEESLEVEIKRYWIALTHDEREWRVLKWEEMDEDSSTYLAENDRFAASRNYGYGPKSPQVANRLDRAFKLPSFEARGYGGDTHKVVVAYTPELWAGLLTIVRSIKLAREQIGKLVGTKDGIQAVVAIGLGKQQLRLTAGEKK